MPCAKGAKGAWGGNGVISRLPFRTRAYTAAYARNHLPIQTRTRMRSPEHQVGRRMDAEGRAWDVHLHAHDIRHLSLPAKEAANQ